jgi:acyl-homoserine-lactone acylase
VARCTATPSATAGGKTVDLKEACDVLGAWDKRYALTSVGAVLWREFLASFSGATTDKGKLFAAAFDPAAPIDTPKTLAAAPATGDDPVLVALALATQRLAVAGLGVSAKLGDVQHTTRGGTVTPIHGGQDYEGAFNVVGYLKESGTLLPSLKEGDVLTVDPSDPASPPVPTDLTSDGYLVNVGSSFMMVLEYTDAGPHAKAVLSYSQSSDPASAHYSDETELFSKSQYRDILFTEEDIKADTNLKVTTLDIP